MSAGTSEEDLISAVTESLEQNGKLSKLRAKIRREVLTVLNSHKNDMDNNKMPLLTDDVQLINELIREYLDWMEYKCTSSMLVAESGMSDSPIPRAVLSNQLTVTSEENSVQVPTLVNLVTAYKSTDSSKREKLCIYSEPR